MRDDQRVTTFTYTESNTSFHVARSISGSRARTAEIRRSKVKKRPHYVDSMTCVLARENLADVDCRGLSDTAIAELRAESVDHIYQLMVEDRRMEGLMFKDLAAPYYLGKNSNQFKYWLKFKPDYTEDAVASDLDVIILGAFFATGLRAAGHPSTFLCGCVDENDPTKFFTLCKVSYFACTVPSYSIPSIAYELF